MGKPVDAGDAASMLQAFPEASTRSTRRSLCAAASVQRRGRDDAVRFNTLSDAEIAWYISTGEADGKGRRLWDSGPCGARFIDRIDGSWSNVVGLPIATVYRLLSTCAARMAPRGGSIDRVQR